MNKTFLSPTDRLYEQEKNGVLEQISSAIQSAEIAVYLHFIHFSPAF